MNNVGKGLLNTYICEKMIIRGVVMIKKICNILLGFIILILVLIAGVLFVPRFLGYESFAVISGSMTPEKSVGSIVFAHKTPFDELQTGDVISFHLSDSNNATHRIVAIDHEKKEFTTKGDANKNNDANPVPYNKVIGKVAFTVPLLGFISVYIKTPIGIFFACGIALLMILLNFLPEIFEKKK